MLCCRATTHRTAMNVIITLHRPRRPAMSVIKSSSHYIDQSTTSSRATDANNKPSRLRRGRGGFKAESLLGHAHYLLSLPSFPSPPLPSPPSPPLSFHSLFPPFPSHPLEVGPPNPARGSGGVVSSPSGVWGGAPVEIEFGAF